MSPGVLKVKSGCAQVKIGPLEKGGRDRSKQRAGSAALAVPAVLDHGADDVHVRVIGPD